MNFPKMESELNSVSSILKSKEPHRSLTHNLDNYKYIQEHFSWDEMRKELNFAADGPTANISYMCVDRHLQYPGMANKVALKFIDKKGSITSITFLDLQKRANKMANVLSTLAPNKGDAVFALLPRVPDLYYTALGCWRNLNVFGPLFSAFGPDPILSRLKIGKARILVTTLGYYKKKVLPIRSELKELTYILLIDSLENGSAEKLGEGVIFLSSLMEKANEKFIVRPTKPEDVATYHFTSGTTGFPKGAIHVHEALLMHYMTGKYVLDFHPFDVYWCTADPGWVTGTSYGIISPLVCGVTSLIDEGEFNTKRWCRILQDQQVSIWYTAPTAIRMLMKAGKEVIENYSFKNLRFVASVGEPLNPEAIRWGQENLKMLIHDNWWQTETGGIMIANFPSMEIKLGSMGKPLPGIEVDILRSKEDGLYEKVSSPEEKGILAIKTPWPSMFRGFIGDPERYDKCFFGNYYLTGDLAKRDQDGYFWFIGRSDDVIKTAGHLIGPFEVESVLMEHPAVAEAGVIGLPDLVAMNIIKAFVSLKKGYVGDDKLKTEIMVLARKKLGSTVAPKEIQFLPSLPKTRSGKIMRRLLRARELGLPEGDTSTLETSEPSIES